MSSSELIETEKLIESVGPFGLYQKLYMALLQLQSLFYTMAFVFMTFAILEPKYSCRDQLNADFKDNCEVISNCTNFSTTLKADFYSLKAEWPHIVEQRCSQGNSLDPLLLIYSIREVSDGLVHCFAGILADLFGRKPMILMGSSLVVISAFAAAFSPNLTIFAVFYFLISFGAALKGTSMTLLGSESTLSGYRLSINICTTWAFTYPLLALVAFLVKSWRKLLLVGGTLGLASVVGFALCPESPRWLLVHQRYEKAAQSLNRIAHINSRPANFKADDLKAIQSGTVKLATKNPLKIWFNEIKTVCKESNNKKLSMYLIFALFNQFILYAITTNFIVNAGEFITSPYLSVALIGLFRIWTPCFIIILDLRKSGFNRRLFLTFSFVCVLIPLTVATIIAISRQYASESSADALDTAVALCAICSTAMSFGLLYYAVYQVTIEVFPTVARSGAISLISIAGTIGGAVGPQVILLKNVWPPLHYVVACLCTFAAFLAAYFVVPETKNAPLPDRFGDIKMVLTSSKKIYPDTKGQPQTVSS